MTVTAEPGIELGTDGMDDLDRELVRRIDLAKALILEQLLHHGEEMEWRDLWEETGASRLTFRIAVDRLVEVGLIRKRHLVHFYTGEPMCFLELVA